MPKPREATKLVLGETTFSAKPLLLDDLETLDESMRLLGKYQPGEGLPGKAQVNAMKEIVYASVARGQPGIPRELFFTTVGGLPLLEGIEQIAEAFNTVMEISNVSGPKKAEGSAQGEAKGPPTA